VKGRLIFRYKCRRVYLSDTRIWTEHTGNERFGCMFAAGERINSLSRATLRRAVLGKKDEVGPWLLYIGPKTLQIGCWKFTGKARRVILRWARRQLAAGRKD
jgi:hypothetical protein